MLISHAAFPLRGWNIPFTGFGPKKLWPIFSIPTSFSLISSRTSGRSCEIIFPFTSPHSYLIFFATWPKPPLKSAFSTVSFVVSSLLSLSFKGKMLMAKDVAMPCTFRAAFQSAKYSASSFTCSHIVNLFVRCQSVYELFASDWGLFHPSALKNSESWLKTGVYSPGLDTSKPHVAYGFAEPKTHKRPVTIKWNSPGVG